MPCMHYHNGLISVTIVIIITQTQCIRYIPSHRRLCSIKCYIHYIHIATHSQTYAHAKPQQFTLGIHLLIKHWQCSTTQPDKQQVHLNIALASASDLQTPSADFRLTEHWCLGYMWVESVSIGEKWRSGARVAMMALWCPKIRCVWSGISVAVQALRFFFNFLIFWNFFSVCM